MSFLPFDAPPVLLSLGVHLAGGLMLGLLYFGTLWWNTRLLSLTGHAKVAAALMIGRFLALGGLLSLASLEGALPLLGMALGVLFGRAVIMHRLRRVAA